MVFISVATRVSMVYMAERMVFVCLVHSSKDWISFTIESPVGEIGSDILKGDKKTKTKQFKWIFGSEELRPEVNRAFLGA